MYIITNNFYCIIVRFSIRVIYSGAGADGGVSFMRQQLKWTSSEIVYLDFDKRSMKVTQFGARLGVILNNIWITGLIGSIHYCGLGYFHLVVATADLHPLKRPQIRLQLLNDTQWGLRCAQFMVYAKYGRSCDYHVQTL